MTWSWWVEAPLSAADLTDPNLTDAPVRLFGWVAEHARGVTYETLGINGAQASIVFNWLSN